MGLLEETAFTLQKCATNGILVSIGSDLCLREGEASKRPGSKQSQTYTERLRSSLMALISIFLRPMVSCVCERWLKRIGTRQGAETSRAVGQVYLYGATETVTVTGAARTGANGMGMGASSDKQAAAALGARDPARRRAQEVESKSTRQRTTAARHCRERSFCSRARQTTQARGRRAAKASVPVGARAVQV